MSIRILKRFQSDRVLCHPFVIGEVALGHLRRRDRILNNLRSLPQAVVARNEEVLLLIVQASIFGSGIGYVDAHLLASVRMTPGVTLWTRDKRLQSAAARLNLAFAAAEER